MLLPGLKPIKSLSEHLDLRFGVAPLWLALGGFLMGVTELIGVTAIFPLILLITNPSIVSGDNLLAMLYNRMGLQDVRQFVAILGTGIAMIFILKGLFNILYLRYEFGLLARWRAEIAGKIYRHYIDSPYSSFVQKNSSDIIAIITTHIPGIVNNYMHPVINLYGYTMTMLLLVSYIIYLNWVGAVIVGVVCGGLLFVQSRIHRRKLNNLNILSSELQATQYKLLQQSIMGFKETRIHGKEEYFLGNFLNAIRHLGLTEQKVLLYRTLPSVTVELVIFLSVIIVFSVLMYTGTQLEIIVAQLGAMAMAAFRFIPLINRSITALVTINSGQHSINLVLRECEETRKPVIQSSIRESVEFTKDLRLESVSYSYGNTARVLHNIDFSLTPGQFVGVTGPSGGGKSTLAHVLLGLITEYEGTYKINDTLIKAENITALHKIIGFVDQQIFLMDSSIAENVAFGVDPAQIDRNRVEQCLKKAQIWDFIATQKAGIDTRTGELGKWLSGGQRQRLGIARALYRDLKILILDEASSALDIETERRLFEFLRTLKGEISIIMIAHRLSTLKDCDRVDFMDKGTIVDSGTFAELYQKNTTFKTYIDYSQIEHSNES